MAFDNDYLGQLLFEEESNSLDFKSQQYKFTNGTEEEKSELLKDVLAFVNSFRRTAAFILIGVQEIKGNKCNIVGISELLDDANLQQFVNSKTNKPVEFSYQNRTFDSKQIAVINIPIQERPIYSTKDYGRVKKNVVYLRRGSSTGEASPEEISKMGVTSIAVSNIPDLRLFFIDRENERHETINVKAFKMYGKSKLLEKLANLTINEFDLKMVRKYKSKLEMFTERLPNGTVFHPYSASHVEDFIRETKDKVSLVENDFENFCKNYNLVKRSFSFEYHSKGMSVMSFTHGNPPGYGNLFQLHNSGTCPSTKMIVYIKSNKQVEFLKYNDLLKRNIEIDNKLPEYITDVFEKANEISQGLKVPDPSIFQNSSFLSPFFNRPINEFEKKIEITLNKGLVEIGINQELMHNHSIKLYLDDILICPMVKKDELTNIEYEIHASNMPRPVSGSLKIRGI